MNESQQKELDKCIDKIRNYHKGFEFTIHFSEMTKPQENAMRLILKKAEAEGLIESIAIGHSLEDLRGESGRFNCEETFRRK